MPADVPRLLLREGAVPTAQAMHASRQALDRPLEGDAELSVLTLTTAATVLGAFRRTLTTPDDRDRPCMLRGSGGPLVRVSPGTIHVLLSLAHPSVLVPCDAGKLVNRYVRPLLRGLTRSGALAHYFGRDWVSVGHRPVAQVGFAHDSETRRTVFEAFVAMTEPLADEPRASFLGKEPGTLASAASRSFDGEVVRGRIAQAYVGMREVELCPREDLFVEEGSALAPEVPWAAVTADAIGEVAAGIDRSGVLRLGGDFLASRDAVARVCARVAALIERTPAAVGSIVDEELTRPGVAFEGVRDLGVVRDVLLRAL